MTAAALLLGCAPAADNGLRQDLTRESAVTGLAIVQIRSDELALIPFDGKERFFQAEYGQPVVAAFGEAGRMVAWYSPPFFGAGELLVTDGDGSAVVRRSLVVSGFFPVAFSEATMRLAFSGSLPPEDPRVGLRWMSLDSSAQGFVGSYSSDEVDWSADGQTLAYEKDGQMYLFNVETNTLRAVGSGHDPTLCPDGRRLAFRGDDGRPSIMTLDKGSISHPFGSLRVKGVVRWSPEGRFVMLTEPLKPIPLIGSQYQLWVGRVSDGALAAIRKFGGIAGDYYAYHWIVDYRKFCSRCKPGRSFH